MAIVMPRIETKITYLDKYFQSPIIATSNKKFEEMVNCNEEQDIVNLQQACDGTTFMYKSTVNKTGEFWLTNMPNRLVESLINTVEKDKFRNPKTEGTMIFQYNNEEIKLKNFSIIKLHHNEYIAFIYDELEKSNLLNNPS